MSRDVHASAKARPAGQPGSNARSVYQTDKRRPAESYVAYIGAEPVVPTAVQAPPKRGRKAR